MTISPAPGTAAYNDQLAHWDDDLRPQSVAASIIVMTASTAIIITRISSKIIYTKGIGLADWLILVAWVITIGMSVGQLLSFSYGFGLHQLRVILSDKNPPHALVLAFETGDIVSFAWVPALACVKLSLLLYYNELFQVHQSWLKIVSWIMAAYTIAWALASTPVLLFQCLPVPYFWDRMALLYGMETKAATDGRCLPQLAHLAAPSIANTFSDIVIIAIPIIVLSTLQLPLQRKIGLLFLFTLGVFDIAASIVRIVYVFPVSAVQDVTWINTGVVVWTVVETNLAIVCASIPPSMPIISAGLRRLGVSLWKMKKITTRRHFNLSTRREQRRLPLDSQEDMYHEYVSSSALPVVEQEMVDSVMIESKSSGPTHIWSH